MKDLSILITQRSFRLALFFKIERRKLNENNVFCSSDGGCDRSVGG